MSNRKTRKGVSAALGIGNLIFLAEPSTIRSPSSFSFGELLNFTTTSYLAATAELEDALTEEFPEELYFNKIPTLVINRVFLQ